MSANISRSDVLRPLAWLVGILAITFIGSLFAKAPVWVLELDGISFALSLVLYGFTYIYCLFKDRDALRSERYSLQKMAIEQGFYGDNRTGLVEDSGRGTGPLVETAQTPSLEGGVR